MEEESADAEFIKSDASAIHMDETVKLQEANDPMSTDFTLGITQRGDGSEILNDNSEEKYVSHDQNNDSVLGDTTVTGQSATASNMETTAQPDSSEVDKDNSDTMDDVTGGVASNSVPQNTRCEHFTSEIYKIEILNLPRFGFKQLKKRLASLDVNPVKIKAVDRKHFAFATFRNEEEREDAMKKISGHIWKDRKLKVKKASAAADPMMKRRQEDSADGDAPLQKRSKQDIEDDNIPPEIRLRKAYAPLWDMPYEDQLKLKMADVTNVIKSFSNHIYKNNKDFQSWLKEQRDKHNGLCCELLPIKPSPRVSKYRNKCEFTIGKDINGKDKTVGFRFGLYKDGLVCVGMDKDNPDTIIPDSMQRIVQAFEEFLEGSEYGSFDTVKHDGHWRMLTVRTCLHSNDAMIMADFHPQQLSQDCVDKERDRLKEYFVSGTGSTCGVTSIYFNGKQEKPTGNSSYEHLYGEKHVEETLLGLKFRVSPSAFFQVNTSAAELLYQQIIDWCNVSSDTVVLDICCGTGTIGLCVAKKVSQVIGIEMCEEAINDAKKNAEINDVDNVRYICSKVEDAIKYTLKSLRTPNVVAVVDPPRPGLHSSVFQALRRSPHITKVVFVSCKPTAILNNFDDLTRAVSKRCKGPPYKPVKAVPVDMFPQTTHCELVVLFEREKAYEDPYDSP